MAMKTHSTSKTLIPKLRFPEFRESWDVKAIGELLEERSRPIELQPDKDYALVTVKRRYGGVVPRETLKGKEILVKSQFLVEPNDFLISKRQIVHNACGVVPAELDQSVVSNEYSVLAARSGCEMDFFNYFSQQPSVSRSFMHSSVGIVIEKMLFKLNVWLELRFPFPSPAEQLRIGACLTSLDQLLAAEGRKLEALRTYKKGLMQQLFPRASESRPRLRFPEFADAGGWRETALARVIEVASGQVDPTESPYCDLPHVGGENIESETGNIQGLRSAREDAVISGKYPFDERDILYSKIRPALNKVAAPDFRGICSADIYPIRPSSNELLREYLVYLLRSKSFVEYATKHSVRGKIPKINREALLGYGAFLPSPAEQQRIAACLSSLDAWIIAQSRKMEALRNLKRGLMQQLFPSPEE
jgi:type I restriction enzyme S subunit